MMTRHIALFGVALLATSPDTLWAQDAVAAWSRLDATKGAIVHVLPDVGAEVSGTLLGADPGSLVLLVEGTERRFEQTHVRRIDRRGDRLRNGAFIGAGVGAVIGLLTALIADCPNPEPGGACPGARAAGFALSVGAYSAIGVGIDALAIGRTTLYESAAIPSRATRERARAFSVASLSVRW